MSKFFAGERVRSRSNPRLVGTVEEGKCGHGMVRFRLDQPTQVNSTKEVLTMFEYDVEYAFCPLVQVGQRILVLNSPRPESQFVIGMKGTVLAPENGETFEVRLDNGKHIWCSRSMIRFLDETEPEPVLDETFLCEGMRSSDRRCIDEKLYEYTFKGLVPVARNDFQYQGGALKLTMRSQALFNRKYRLTLTPIKEPTATPLPCPFCGKPAVDDGTSINCPKGHAAMFGPKEERTAKWNRRQS